MNKKKHRTFFVFSSLRKLKIYLLLLMTMFFSSEGWCGRGCLGLSDSEITNNSLSRVFRHMNDFFNEHEATISSLTQQDPDIFMTVAQGKKTSSVFSISTKKIFHEMRTKETTFIGQDYADNPELLKIHLTAIKLAAKNGASDLAPEKNNILKGYANLLLFLSKF